MSRGVTVNLASSSGMLTVHLWDGDKIVSKVTGMEGENETEVATVKHDGGTGLPMRIRATPVRVSRLLPQSVMDAASAVAGKAIWPETVHRTVKSDQTIMDEHPEWPLTI